MGGTKTDGKSHGQGGQDMAKAGKTWKNAGKGKELEVDITRVFTEIVGEILGGRGNWMFFG